MRLGLLPAQPPQQLAHGLRRDAEATGDRTVRCTLPLQLAGQPEPRSSRARSAARIPAAATQRCQPAHLETSLEPPHCARGAVERAPHVVLIRPALLDQACHRVRLGHPIADGVLREHHAGHEHDPMRPFAPHDAAIVDDHHVGRTLVLREELLLPARLAHAGTLFRPNEKADRFGSPPPVSSYAGSRRVAGCRSGGLDSRRARLGAGLEAP